MLYTRTGDNGTTSLASGERVLKTDGRIETYGTIDELNSCVGMLYCECALLKEKIGEAVLEDLLSIQNKLFNIGAYLSEAQGEWLTVSDVTRMERCIDALQAETPALRAFVLPSGNRAMCASHICRTVSRRAERLLVGLVSDPLWKEKHKADKQVEDVTRYVNRLSDYFFALSRWLGHKCDISEQIWTKM